MKIKSILIANRGEIAVRIIRAAKSLGLKTVQVYSDADADSMAVKMADEAINIGSPMASKSYLNINLLVETAKRAKVDAIHPGYGFLSENADFADATREAGIIFIGPRGATIRKLGDKVAARQLAKEAGVPTVPGSDGRLEDLDEAIKVAKDIGYPLMVKALAGGGGKGIRIVNNEEELKTMYSVAFNEAKAIFGDGGLYIEKYIQKARHIEVQILGDGENFIHCYERECSIQRRRQKIWEEAPAIGIPEDVLDKMHKSSVELIKKVSYRGAGTVEYVYDNDTQEFYFIETNTRIQVEHPVTGMITGIDLVAEMIKIAGGMPLEIKQEDVKVKGHAIECRINAEDTTKNFMPCPGKIEKLSIPEGAGIRFDTFIYEGYTIPMYYDSLIGKLIVLGDNREDALKRLREVLRNISIEGIETTIPLHAQLAENEDVIKGSVDTQFLMKMLDSKD
ncbi:acetyl-CoA carboxylase biotin carboxylase subunit [Muricauda ruestringensis]|uniref:Acetyl-CoA carboxylase biotin carboxylase subunit n=1 Tax=Flagellimonas aurea TaxID=2915619 RepID=A0ABS3G9G7_9FLAO|nr:acetyl-CoA carboxylase biotin carboxylase subunit [Allomuricauda aurea]MBO0356046.1 acetyl-CoA carboxylase biotin carboxylase subunit [Allomuricauda aurea]